MTLLLAGGDVVISMCYINFVLLLKYSSSSGLVSDNCSPNDMLTSTVCYVVSYSYRCLRLAETFLIFFFIFHATESCFGVPIFFFSY